MLSLSFLLQAIGNVLLPGIFGLTQVSPAPVIERFWQHGYKNIPAL
ncbi:hypothetical protein [Xylella fastidiosa]